MRQWKVCQYVRAGADPYRVARDLLEQDATERPASHVLWDVPAGVEQARELGLIEEIGAPCATYPPSVAGVLLFPIGFLPVDSVRVVWVLVNLTFLLLLARSLTLWVGRNRPDGRTVGFLTVLALLLLWPATHASVRNGQFSIPIAVFLLWWMGMPRNAHWRTGLLIALALIKPSLSLPFLAVPLARRQWRALAIAGGIHGVALVGLAAAVQVSPLRLMSEWMEVAGFFMRGQYSLQEVLIGLGLQQSFTGTMVTLLALGAVMIWTWMHRRAPPAKLVAWLCAGSLMWTYHGPYDFVLLVVPIALALAQTPGEQTGMGSRRLLLVAVALLGVALLPSVFAGDAGVHRVLRWSGRLGFAAFLAITGWQCRVARPLGQHGFSLPGAPAATGESSRRSESTSRRHPTHA